MKINCCYEKVSRLSFVDIYGLSGNIKINGKVICILLTIFDHFDSKYDIIEIIINVLIIHQNLGNMHDWAPKFQVRNNKS